MAQNIYYIHKNGKQVGPVSIDILQNMVKANELTQTDLVWIKNSPSWVKAGSLQELFPTAPPLPPDPDQAVVYQHNETLISSGNKEDLKWYSIGGAGIFIGLILLASTSRNFLLVKTRTTSDELNESLISARKMREGVENYSKGIKDEMQKKNINSKTK
jgi:GYF domain 2